MSDGCRNCACYRRGVDAKAEQDAAWATYQDNVRPPSEPPAFPRELIQRWLDRAG